MRPESAPEGSLRPTLVYRQVTLTVPAFDRLKDWQRRLQQDHKRPFTNGEVLDHLLLAAKPPSG